MDEKSMLDKIPNDKSGMSNTPNYQQLSLKQETSKTEGQNPS